MRQLKLIWVVFVLGLFAGCSGGGGKAPTQADAGQPQASAVFPNWDPAKAPTPRATVAPKQPPKVSIQRSALGQIVDACAARSYSTWAQAKACFDAGGPDALVPGKLKATRPPGTTNPAWLVQSWFVNASTGSDLNTCFDSGTPCKTFAEIVNRWETPSPVITNAVTITNAVDTTECVSMSPFLPLTTASLTIQSNLTVVSSGTVSGTVPRNRPANQALDVNLGAAAAGSPGLLFVDITRASRGWVDAIVSGNVVRLSQPMFIGSGDFTEDVGVTNGDSFSIERPAKLCIDQFTSASSIGNSGFTALTTSWAFTGSGQFANLGSTIVTASRSDEYINGSSGTLANVQGEVGQSGSFSNEELIAGIISGPIMAGGRFDSDIIIHGQPQISPGSIISIVEYTFLYADAGGSAPWSIFGVLEANGAAQIYGSYTFYPAQTGGAVVYTGPNYPSVAPTCVGSFPGIHSLIYPEVTATAVDRTVSGSLQVYQGRALSCGAMDAPVNGASGTGFGGVAYNDVLQPIFFAFGLNDSGGVPTSSYVLPNIPCPAGQSPVSDGAHYTSCATPGGGGGGVVTLAGDTVGPSNANQTKGLWAHAVSDPALSFGSPIQAAFLSWNSIGFNWSTNIQTTNLPVAGVSNVFQTTSLGAWNEVQANSTAFNNTSGTVTTVGAGFVVLGTTTVNVPEVGTTSYGVAVNGSYNAQMAVTTCSGAATQVQICPTIDGATVFCQTATMANPGSDTYYEGLPITQGGGITADFAPGTLSTGSHTFGVAAALVGGSNCSVSITAPFNLSITSL